MIRHSLWTDLSITIQQCLSPSVLALMLSRFYLWERTCNAGMWLSRNFKRKNIPLLISQQTFLFSFSHFQFFYFFAKFLFFRIYRTSHWQLLSYKYIAKEDLPALFLEPEGLLSSIHLLSQHFQYSFFEIHQVILFRLPEPKLLLQSPLEFRML